MWLPRKKHRTGSGIFDTGFGIAWFAGSAITGLLNDKPIPALVSFSMNLQILALPVFVLAKRREERRFL
jgi:predicted MFS family arabinose efflux permease